MKRVLSWLLACALLGGLALVVYRYINPEPPARDLSLNLPPAQQAPQDDDQPVIRYPLPAVPDATPSKPPLPVQSQQPAPSTDAGEGPPEGVAPPPALPALDRSDGVVLQALADVFAGQDIRRFLHADALVRRLVATVDNLPRSKLPRKYVATQATPGQFAVLGQDQALMLDPENYARYTPFVRLATAVDSEQLVAAYVRLYPLFQRAYQDLGYPSGYFNDRLVQVIEHLLETPTVRGPVRLVRPHVLYRYADPELEALSSGQKVLLRTGPDNATRLKDKLQEILLILKRGG